MSYYSISFPSPNLPATLRIAMTNIEHSHANRNTITAPAVTPAITSSIFSSSVKEQPGGKSTGLVDLLFLVEPPPEPQEGRYIHHHECYDERDEYEMLWEVSTMHHRVGRQGRIICEHQSKPPHQPRTPDDKSEQSSFHRACQNLLIIESYARWSKYQPAYTTTIVSTSSGHDVK